MKRVVYVSQSTALSEDEAAIHLAAILMISRKLNQERGITGALAYGNGWFTQVLEGATDPLMHTLTSILGDARHTNVQILEMVPIESRRFHGWSMAFAGDVCPLQLRRSVELQEQRQQGIVPGSVVTLIDLALLSDEIAKTFSQRLPLH